PDDQRGRVPQHRYGRGCPHLVQLRSWSPVWVDRTGLSFSPSRNAACSLRSSSHRGRVNDSYDARTLRRATDARSVSFASSSTVFPAVAIGSSITSRSRAKVLSPIRPSGWLIVVSAGI